MPPLTYIHASEAARTTAGGRGVGGGKITPPTACKWLKIVVAVPCVHSQGWRRGLWLTQETTNIYNSL